jgi:hypothetical protein
MESNCVVGHPQGHTEACRMPCKVCQEPAYYGHMNGWFCVTHWVQYWVEANRGD